MTDELQFDKLEATGAPAAARAGVACAQCGTPITSLYYEAACKTFCGDCMRHLETHFRQSQFTRASFLRGAVFGLGGAIAGALVYFGVAAATGYEIGLISIVVGYMVGWSVHRGSGGRAGRSYQVLALVLTYYAIGTAYLSSILKDTWSERKETITVTADSTAVDSVTDVVIDDSAATTGAAARADAPRGPGFFKALVGLVMFAFALPVVVSFGGLPASLLSALIIGFALQQAWRMNAAPQVKFAGPFFVKATPPTASAP